MIEWKPLDTVPEDRLILLWLWPLDVIAGVKPIRSADGSVVYVTRRGYPISLGRCRAWIDPKDFPDTPEAADFEPSL